MDRPRNHERWMWIELIGFDNELPDFGVAGFLERAGFVPDAICILMYTPDFVHTHEGLDEERVFPPDFCSYRAHPTNRERSRQAWTNHQLRALIGELQTRGVAVYVSFFNLFTSVIDGEMYRSPWSEAHPELMEITRTGESVGALNPLRRFEDGSLYEDFFLERLLAVIEDYGFDGYHGADGYSCTRRPLVIAGYSDDMVDQFLDATGLSLPENLEAKCEGDSAAMSARSDWIWREHRAEWLRFYSTRWASFWRKVTEAVHGLGRRVVLNNAWTRDPFEALYRYGIDYRLLADAGIDGFICETVGAGMSTGAETVEANPYYDFLAMLLTMKAYTPELPLLCLNGVDDITEQWDVLRHVPTVSEREIYSLAALHVRDAAGLARCSAGPVVCLADGIETHEWAWLRRRWDLGFAAEPEAIIGGTVVWSDAAFDAHLDDFIATRRWPTHKLVHELMRKGAPILTAARVEDVASVRGPVIVPNPHLWPEAELAHVLDAADGPVIMIGGDADGLPEPEMRLQSGAMVCTVYGCEPDVQVALGDCEAEEFTEDALGIEDPTSFVFDLEFRPVDSAFVEACAQIIATCSGAPQVSSDGDVAKAWAMQLADGRMRVYIGNDAMFYSWATVDMGRAIAAVDILTEFPCMPVTPDDSRFMLRVPWRGMVVVDVTLA